MVSASSGCHVTLCLVAWSLVSGVFFFVRGYVQDFDRDSMWLS
jgi:hypothetical protein